MNHKANKHATFIKEQAYLLGFDFVGISKAGFLEEDAPKLEKWLKAELHGKMQYMENHFEKRLDPKKLVEGSKSVISLLYNYSTDVKQKDTSSPKISKYAFGEDYHYVVKEKLKLLFEKIEDEIGNVEGRMFVDSAPVLDRAWARKSGLGWIGKNGMLITKQYGSEFFIAELILDLELEVDGPINDYCGTCTKCIDACPTEAILPNRELDAKRCISYLTIELKEDTFAEEFKGSMDNWMFGCDVCQDVCPWNRFSKSHNEPRFIPHNDLLEMTKRDWEGLEKEKFNGLFKKSAVKRTKFEGLKRNIDFLKQ